MKVYIVGEDDATREIIKRVLNFCSSKFEILLSLPVRGSQIKSNIIKYNKLAEHYPVILLLDLDANNCPPEILNYYFSDTTKNDKFIFNIADDEAEAWLMADRKNFSDYFQVPIDNIPLPKNIVKRKKSFYEMSFPYKSSYYMVNEIIPNSRKTEFKQQMIPHKGAKKGKEYNTALNPYIQDIWKIENAINNSISLHKMILRVNDLLMRIT